MKSGLNRVQAGVVVACPLLHRQTPGSRSIWSTDRLAGAVVVVAAAAEEEEEEEEEEEVGLLRPRTATWSPSSEPPKCGPSQEGLPTGQPDSVDKLLANGPVPKPQPTSRSSPIASCRSITLLPRNAARGW